MEKFVLKRAHLGFALLLWIACSAGYCGRILGAVTSASTLELPDHGRICTFETALDEIHRPGVLATEHVPAQADREALRNYITQRSEKKVGPGWELILYRAGESRSAASRRYMGRELAARLKDGTSTADIGSLEGVQAVRSIDFMRGWYMISGSDPVGALKLYRALADNPNVLVVQPMLARQAHKKLVPKDPYFSQQWHLRNTGQNGGARGMDIHVTNVWDNWRGKGVHIAVVDDGLQYTHPDLAAGYDPAYSYDFNGSDRDPYPNVGADDSHGTAVTGVIGARAGNARGGAGVAFECTLSGLRLIALPSTDQEEAAAMLHSNSVIQIKNNSWGAEDCPTLGTTLEGPGPLAKAALGEGVSSGRGGLGEIYVWDSGNGGDCDEDVNCDGYANSTEVIAVGAVDYQGFPLSYSEHGACMLVAAPTGDVGFPEIFTTDLLGEYGENYSGAFDDVSDTDYTRDFNGTSAACPIVSGVVGLMLQARPDLGWRDVQEVLLRSAAKVPVADRGWSTNAAGVRHHYLVGGGLVDAEAAIKLATNWATLSPATSMSQSITGLVTAITSVGLTNEFVFNAPGFRVEHAAITLTTTHPNWGDIDIRLVSPNGYESWLARPHTVNPATDYRDWTLTSVRHWGEKADGRWRVIFIDSVQGNTGLLNSVRLTLYGSQPESRLSVELGGGPPVLTLHAAADGWIYSLEASPDLATWSPVGQMIIPGSGVVQLADKAGDVGANRFYRARLL